MPSMRSLENYIPDPAQLLVLTSPPRSPLLLLPSSPIPFLLYSLLMLLQPSHLRHQFLPGHTNDNKPIVVRYFYFVFIFYLLLNHTCIVLICFNRTITGIVTEQDMEIAKTFLQAEHEFLLTFTHSPFLVHNTSYFCGDTPPPIKMRGYSPPIALFFPSHSSSLPLYYKKN